VLQHTGFQYGLSVTPQIWHG